MGSLSLARFRCEITPPLGHSLLAGLVPPAIAIDDSLEAIGCVLFGAGSPIVICVLDWAALTNDAHRTWRTTLATAAGTTPERVTIHCVHQHNTPFVCPDAHAIVEAQADLPPMFDRPFVDACLQRVAAALRQSLPRAEAVTHVAHGRAHIERVASNRRVDRDEHGRVRAMRFSACTDPRLIALPEGVVDPELQTVAFFDGQGRKIAAWHYYATHPMSYYRDGRVTSDFCGLARKRRQADEPECTRLYFTGCAGNVSAGKYNDGSPSARRELTDRVYAGIVASEATLAPQPLTDVAWRTVDVLPLPQATPSEPELRAIIADSGHPLAQRILSAFRLGWLQRHAQGWPIVLSRLRLNEISILHLPGEMFVEYQLRARAMRSPAPVAVAAYGDGGLWYVPTKEEYPNGGYETSVAFCSEAADEIFTRALRQLLE